MTAADDELDIRALLGRTALVGDEGRAEDYAEVYATDAVWSFGGSTQTGIDEIIAGARARRERGTSGPGSNTRHVVAPMQVDVQGDTATAVSYFLFLGDTASVPTLRSFGTYRDVLVRDHEAWRISRRTGDIG